MDAISLLQAGWKRKDASGNDIFADKAYIQSILADVVSVDIGGDLHEYYVGDHDGTPTGELLGYDTKAVSPDVHHASPNECYRCHPPPPSSSCTRGILIEDIFSSWICHDCHHTQQCNATAILKSCRPCAHGCSIYAA